MATAVLKLQIGPVQEFIAQARSTRDLWSGSYLLSWLMAAGARELVESAGGKAVVVISPVLRGQPIFDFQGDKSVLGRLHSNDAILTPNFTNILVAQLPVNEAGQAVEAMVRAIKSERDAIATACWEKLKEASLVGKEQEERFFTQVGRFPAITWRITPPPPSGNREAWLQSVPLVPELRAKLLAADDDFPAQITRNAWDLDAVRSLREFTAWNSGAGVFQKDALSGREEGVLGGGDWWKEHFESRQEHLGGRMQRVLRLTPTRGRHRDSELWPILFGERQKSDWLGALQVIKRVWHWAYLTELRGLEATHRRLPKRGEFPFPSTAHLALHDPAKNLDENTDEMNDATRVEIQAEREHTPYFAVLALDGDQMGAWLGGEKSPSGPTQSFRDQLSSRVADFSTHCVRPIVEACDGRLILAGGDDVLALLPADTAVDCASYLRLAFRGDASFIPPLKKLAEQLRGHHRRHHRMEPTVADEKPTGVSPFLVAAANGTLFAAGVEPGTLCLKHSIEPVDSQSSVASELHLRLPGGIERSPGVAVPDVSAGIAIAHFKEPLQDVVQAAWAAEKRAKEQLSRGALAVTVVKHSGETVQWGAKWDSRGLELLECIQRGRGVGVFSSRFPHRVAEVLSPYLLARGGDEPAWLDAAADFDRQATEVILREFHRVVERQRGDGSDSDRMAFLSAPDTNPLAHLRALLDSLAGRKAQEKLRAVIGLCQVAAFIEPAVHSPSFVPAQVTP